jgi:hypothetical protein
LETEKEEEEKSERVRRKQEVVSELKQHQRPGEEQRLLLLLPIRLVLRLLVSDLAEERRRTRARYLVSTIATITITHATGHDLFLLLLLLLSLQLAQHLSVAVIWWGQTRWRGIPIDRME